MPDYVNRVANALQSDLKYYIRYRAKQLFRRNEPTARSMRMKVQSVESNGVPCNVFRFNVQQGYQTNYAAEQARR